MSLISAGPPAKRFTVSSQKIDITKSVDIGKIVLARFARDTFNDTLMLRFKYLIQRLTPKVLANVLLLVDVRVIQG